MTIQHSSALQRTDANAADPHVDVSHEAPTVALALPADPPTRAGRYDPYLVIHKGMRALVGDALLRAGRMDPLDDEDTAQVIAQIRELIALAQSHADHEERFLHPAMEARAPGSTRHVEDDHRSHREALARLGGACVAVERSAGPGRAAAALDLYRALALFAAKDLVHMHAEETENNAVLWATYADDELIAITERLVASIPPEKNAIYARWMVAASSPAERARLLGNARGKMPAAAFAGMLQGLLAQLDGKNRRKLEAALA